MTQFKLIVILIILLILKNISYSAEIVIGERKVVFSNIKDIPQDVSRSIKSYKDELITSTQITTLKDRLERAILAQGYYDVNINTNNDYLKVELGVPYKISKINYFLNDKLLQNKQKLSNLSLILAENIEATKKVYLNSTAKEYCVFNHHGDVDIDLDKKNKKIIINYYLYGVENTKIGYIKINTNNKISKSFIEKKISFKNGECYSFNKINILKFDLLKTGVLSDVKILQDQNPNTKNIDIDIEVDIKNSKKLESMLELGNKDKISTSFNLNNRNFRSKGEKLDLFAKISKKNRQTSIEHISSDDLMINKIGYEVENTDLQKENLLEYKVSKKYLIRKNISIIAGANIKNSKILYDNKTKREKVTVFAVPLTYNIKYNKGTNDYINHDFLFNTYRSKDNNFFYKTGYRFEGYSKIFPKQNFFFSTNASISKIHGKDIPQTEKTYLGGLGTIRGYKYETLGTLINNKNLAAKGYYFLNTELSYRLNNNWGTGIFYDIGRLSDKKIIKFNNLIDSFGLSVKYYIQDIPISFDLAFPLKKKYAKKTKYQFYLNMGINL